MLSPKCSSCLISNDLSCSYIEQQFSFDEVHTCTLALQVQDQERLLVRNVSLGCVKGKCMVRKEHILIHLLLSTNFYFYMEAQICTCVWNVLIPKT